MTKQIINIELDSLYPTRPLRSILLTLESGSRPKGGVSRIKDGIPSLGGEHISLNGDVVFEKNKKFIPIEFYNSSKQGIVKTGDILICKDGAQTGKIAYVNEKFKYNKSLVNEHIFILRSNNSEVRQIYLFNFLLTDIGQKLLQLKTTGSAQGGLNKPNIYSIKIPVPPIPIQDEIIEKINILEKDNVSIKEDILKSKKQKILFEYLKLSFVEKI